MFELTRSEIIESIHIATGRSKKELVIMKTVDLQNLLLEVSKPVKVRKSTRTCVICKCEKDLSEFGPTHRQVACKGECLRAYSQAARARRKARLELAVEPVRTPAFDLTSYVPVLGF